MDDSNKEIMLSPYLKSFVDQGIVPKDAAEVLNSLPPAQQEAAVKRWKELLDEPARQVVAEFERTAKGVKDPLDFMVYLNAVMIKKEYYPLEEDLDDFIDYLQDEMENFLDATPCQVCGKPMTAKRHIDCSRLDNFRMCEKIRQDLQAMGKPPEPELEAQGKKYADILASLEKQFARGYLKDGTPWNAPKTNTSIRLNKIVDASGHIPGKKNPHHKN